MGHREELKGGCEWDNLTPAKKHYHHKAGGRRFSKAKFNRRVRRLAKLAILPTSPQDSEVVKP